MTNSDELISIAKRIPGHAVLILGDVMLDEYIWGIVKRISPEAPVPVVEIVKRTFAPGGAGNVAINVTSLGGVAQLGGVVGRDQTADRLKEILSSLGVKTSGLLVAEDRPTTVKSRIVAQNQQIVRFDEESHSSLRPQEEDAILGWAEGILPSVDVCLISDYAKGVVSPGLADRFIQMAREANKPILVDPKGSDYTKYQGASIITPNTKEATLAAGLEVNGNEKLEAAAGCLLDKLEGSALLITRGEYGMTLFSNGLDPVHIPTIARQVYDVTGAGDTAIATLALALAAGADLPSAASLANLAAGVVVGKLGTASLDLAELIQVINET